MRYLVVVKSIFAYSLVAVRPRTTIFHLKSTTLPILQIGVVSGSVSEKSEFMDEKGGWREIFRGHRSFRLDSVGAEVRGATQSGTTPT